MFGREKRSMSRKASGVIAGTSNGAEDTQSYKSFIAKKMAERQSRRKNMNSDDRMQNKKTTPTVEDNKKSPVNKDRAKSFLKNKANQGSAGTRVRFQGAKAKDIVEKKGNRLEKKEALLSGARKKLGINEEKRAEFQRRSKNSQAKRRSSRMGRKEMR